MNPDAVFNRYDIRGDYPGEIDEAFAERLGKAAGTYVQEETPRDRVVVGRDAREHAEAVADAFTAGVRATGTNVVDAGVGTTDRTALAANHYGGIGVMVTASHHAWDRTGFKFLYEAGNGFTNDDLARVEELFRAGTFPGGDGARLGVQHEFDELYFERAVEAFEEVADGIDATVVVDGFGAPGRTAPLLFEELGAEVVEHGWDGRPAPEPGRENRDAVRERMEREDADLAVGYDPDGDRVYVIHPELGWISGDKLFYALARTVEADRIVASIDTAPFVSDVGETSYTRVGDVFVAAEGREVDADLLGEPNGHYAVTEFCWYNSGVFCSLLLAAADLPELLAPVRGWTTERRAAAYDDMDARDAALAAARKTIAEQYEVTSTLDGISFEAGEVTGLVRPSGTSPKLRLVVHGQGDIAARADELADALL